MKKILFILPKLGAGGAEKSLLMLLYTLQNKKDTAVDLLLFKQEGIFLEEIPSNVNLIKLDPTLKAAYSKFSFKNFKSFRSILISILRPFVTLFYKIFSKTYNERSQKRWAYCYKYLIKKNKKNYDTAVAYLDGEPLYYLIDKVKANKKVYWNQNEYEPLGFNKKIDKKYISQVDTVVTLSKKCEESLLKCFDLEGKEKCLLSPIISKEYLYEKAVESVPEVFKRVQAQSYFVSIGRLVEQKGFDLAINAAEILRNFGCDFVWIIIGNGVLYNELKNSIREKKLEKYVILEGEQKNPYPYIVNANIFVQSSRYEGKSVILTEAKLLNVPIVSTNYNSVYDQLTNGFDGYICDMKPEELAKTLLMLKSDEDKCKKLKQNLETFNPNRNGLVEDYYKVLEIVS